MDRHNVIEAIDDAFPDLPVPNPHAIIGAVDPDERTSAEQIRSALAGKSWRSLTPQFCDEWWAWFGYLTSEAYRYYVPALLTGGLSTAPEDSPLMHKVVSAINPSFELVNREGHDSYLRARQTSFTEAQYRTVCEFLGTVLSEGTRFDRFQAAQGLRWGWNQFDTPALADANAYFQELSSFNYPESEDPLIANLCREIRSAFAETPYPGDSALCDSQGEEPGEIAPQERTAIIHYLEFRAADEYRAVEINQALENYWRPSLSIADKDQD
jgi:hypothetical protein